MTEEELLAQLVKLGAKITSIDEAVASLEQTLRMRLGDYELMMAQLDLATTALQTIVKRHDEPGFHSDAFAAGTLSALKKELH